MAADKRERGSSGPIPELIEENVPLAARTTLGVGGAAQWFAEITSRESLVEAVGFARARELPMAVLGGGSNLLVRDCGFGGLVLHLALAGPIRQSGEGDQVGISVDAGVDWDALVLQLCEQGICGMECLAGIPGLVGGTPVQNVGAYGQEVAETIRSVTAFDLDVGRFVTLRRAECGFRYRESIFNTSCRGRYVIVAVDFELDRRTRPKVSYADLQSRFAGQEPTALEVYHAVREIRNGKGMLVTAGDPDSRSAGSFFKNPVVTAEAFERLVEEFAEGAVPHWEAGGGVKLSAGWLVERAGFGKGYTLGQAGISSRHTLALINRGGATYADIAALRDQIVKAVESKFRVRLEQEPVELGGAGAEG